MNWPNDADGDVMRSLRKSGFDFDKPTTIDFNVDFESWPPDKRATVAISSAFPQSTISAENDEQYLLVRLYELLSYDLVIRVQSKLSLVTAEFGGSCESWGVLHR